MSFVMGRQLGRITWQNPHCRCALQMFNMIISRCNSLLDGWKWKRFLTLLQNCNILQLCMRSYFAGLHDPLLHTQAQWLASFWAPPPALVFTLWLNSALWWSHLSCFHYVPLPICLFKKTVNKETRKETPFSDSGITRKCSWVWSVLVYSYNLT